MIDLHRVIPGTTVDLDQITTRGKELHDSRKSAEKEFEENRRGIAELQPRLYAEGRQKLLIVLQAIDGGGKDSTIRHVFEGVNPQGVRVVSFKAPSKRELAHDYLWRIHQEVPPQGMIHVFNRSHYEDVLVVRVDQLVPPSVWQPRYNHINQFESYLTETGTTILKFFLHISREEQRERFQDRIDDPEKHWKFAFEDLDKRKQWDEYRLAFTEMLNRCSTEAAPWYLIPADQKWYRNWAISKIILETLQTMNPQYPPAPAGIEDAKIP